MFEIIVILIIIGVIGNLIDWLKNHMDAILGLVGLVVLIGLGFVLLPFAIALLPYALIFWLPYYVIMKGRSSTYLRWARDVGISPQDLAPGSPRVWKWCKKRNYIEELQPGYIVSSEFRDLVLQNIDQKKIVTRVMIQNDCLRAAPSFQIAYTNMFLEYLNNNNFLLSFDEYKRGTLYLSNQLKNDCERLFELEGAATRDEFSALCKTASANSSIAVSSQTIANLILNHMVSQGIVHKVELSDLDEYLFVSNKSNSKSKLVRREISLD